MVGLQGEVLEFSLFLIIKLLRETWGNRRWFWSYRFVNAMATGRCRLTEQRMWNEIESQWPGTCVSSFQTFGISSYLYRFWVSYVSLSGERDQKKWTQRKIPEKAWFGQGRKRPQGAKGIEEWVWTLTFILATFIQGFSSLVAVSALTRCHRTGKLSSLGSLEPYAPSVQPVSVGGYLTVCVVSSSNFSLLFTLFFLLLSMLMAFGRVTETGH